MCADMCLNLGRINCAATSFVAGTLCLLVAFLEVVTAVGRVLAVKIEVAAALARRLAIAFDFPALAFVAGDGDVPVALGPGLRGPVVALPLRIAARVIGRAHGVARVSLVHGRRGAHG